MTRSASATPGKRRRNRARGARTAPELSAAQREACELEIGYKFKDKSLLDRAMTHRSAVPGGQAEWSNERLEFLGDRVLGLVIAGVLIERFPKAREGALAPRLNNLVSRDACAEIGATLGLDRFLIIDAADRAAGAATRPSLLSNATEALLGAIYLDSDLRAATKFIRQHWKQALQAADEVQRDPKSILQEWAQANAGGPPQYDLMDRSGPDHAPTFKVSVSVPGRKSRTGVGPSKQEAERAAAAAMLEQVSND